MLTPGKAFRSRTTGPILANIRVALLVDGPSVEQRRLHDPVGLDLVLEAKGRRWNVVGVIPGETELRVLCVPER
jgi:hypothetical protein